MKNRCLLKILFGVLAAGMMVSCMGMDETAPSAMLAPEIKKFEVKDNGSLVFELSATVDQAVAGRIAECGFYYGKVKNMADAEKIECKMLGGSFSADVILHEYGEIFYACSYISNGVGDNEICSDIKEIRVNELAEYVDFAKPTLISYSKSSAQVSVDYEIAEGVEVTESGVCFGKTESLSLDKDSVKAMDGVAELVDLETGEPYYICSYIKDGDDVAYSKSVPFSVYGVPVVVTDNNPEIDSESALLCGEIEDNCGKDVTERGFLWCEDVAEILEESKNTKIKCGAGVGKFEYTLTGLKPNSTYSFCAYAVNEEGIAYGNVVRFTTGLALPVHGAPTVTGVTPFAAVVTANVLSDGGEVASEQGFFWGIDADNLVNKVVCKGTEFSYEITNLRRNSKYYVKSYSVNSIGTAYSAVLEFTTLPEYPTIETENVTDITEYTARSGGCIRDDGGAEIEEKGVVWSIFHNPTVDLNSKTCDVAGADSFISNLTELDPNRTYYVRAYATNSAGTSYGHELSFTTKTALPVLGTISMSNCTSSSMVLSSSVLNDGGETPSEVGFYYDKSSSFNLSTATKIQTSMNGSTFSAEIGGLDRATEYVICAYAVNSAGEVITHVNNYYTLAELPVVETIAPVNIALLDASCGGIVHDNGGADIIEKGVVWDTVSEPTIEFSSKTNDGGGVGEYSSKIVGLEPNTLYYVRAYATNVSGTSYGQVMTFTTSTGTMLKHANCFIISESGFYLFELVKGNSSESVGDVFSVDVLWESYGTSVVPSVNSLIKSVSCSDKYVVFEIPSTYVEGNAVIAVKDRAGDILWSWHVWLTDVPGECVYTYRNDVMMDRNLGATSAKPGDVAALGLFYQWGRKDPFLGSSSINEPVLSKSTITWPSAVSSSSEVGTIDYAIKHPTTFITLNSSNDDWYYSETSKTDNTRWALDKTMYDPCPYGWKVPSNYVWYEFKNTTFSGYEGMTFYEASSPSTWYPASGNLSSNGNLVSTAINVYYWSYSTAGRYAYALNFNQNHFVYNDAKVSRAVGALVRCIKE